VSVDPDAPISNISLFLVVCAEAISDTVPRTDISKTKIMSTKSELSGGPPPSLPSSIFAFIEPGIKRQPEAPAVVSKSQRGDHLAEAVRESTGSPPKRCDETLRWTYAEFFAVSLSLGEILARKIGGSGPESVVVTFIPNSVEYLLLLAATTIAKTGIASLDVGMLR
jgi:hypothetical protein